MKGVSTVIATILMLMITIALAGTAYLYISGVFTSKQRIISVVDAFCTGSPTGTLSIVLRNDGPDTIRAAEQSVVSDSESCTTDPTAVDIAAGSTVTRPASGCTAGAFHSYRWIGPSNGVQIRERCP